MLQRPQGIHSKPAEVAECVCVPVPCPIPPLPAPGNIFSVCVYSWYEIIIFFCKLPGLGGGEGDSDERI